MRWVGGWVGRKGENMKGGFRLNKTTQLRKYAPSKANKYLLLTYPLNIPEEISQCLLVLVLDKFLQIVGREKQSSVFSSTRIIQSAF